MTVPDVKEMQLNLFSLDRAKLEKELKEREGFFLLFMVYFPKDAYFRPDVTQKQREKAIQAGRAPIPEHQWQKAIKNVNRIEELREILNTIGSL